MKLTSLLLPLILAAQTASFSPQQVSTKGGTLQLWNVDATYPGRASIPAAQIYAVAVAHGVGHMDAGLAMQILSTQASKSPMAIAVEVLGWVGAATAIATIINNGGVVTAGTASKIQNAAVVLAGSAAIVQLQLRPTLKEPNPPAGLLGTELPLVNGSGSALFYSLPSKVAAFVGQLQ